MESFNLGPYLTAGREEVDLELRRIIGRAVRRPERLKEAMEYSLFAGGKRLRPILLLAAATACGGADARRRALPAACALECLHTYSLIHDDLPAMDDDDFRRGRATNHRVFGDAMAILAGDALLTLCFETLAHDLSEVVAEDTLAIISIVGEAAGAAGMVAGQAADMLWEQAESSFQSKAEALEFIHSLKTGALIKAALRVGALLGGAAAEQERALVAFAEAYGLAFQITDDLLDITGDEEKMGKAPGQDKARGKLTYPSLYGVLAAEAKVLELIAEGLTALTLFDSAADPLRALLLALKGRES